MRFRQPPDLFEHIGQLSAGNGSVDAIVVGRQTAHGRKGALAPGPELRAFSLVARDTHLRRPGGLAHRDDACHLLVDVGRRAVQLAQQDCGGVGGIAGVDVRLGGREGEIVHHLESGRNDPRGDDRRHRLAAGAHTGEGGQQDARVGRQGQKLDRHLGDDAEQAFRTGDQGHQVKAGGVRRQAAEGDDLAVQCHQFDRLEIVHRQAVLQAMHAAGVLSHIAADAAGQLRRWVGRIKQAEGGGGVRYGQIAHARLHPRGHRVRVDAKDLVEPTKAQQHAARKRKGPAGKAGSRPARDHGHAEVGADHQDGAHLRSFARQGDQARHATIGGQAVALVNLHRLGCGEQAVARQDRLEPRDQPRTIRRGEGRVKSGIELVEHGGTRIRRGWGRVLSQNPARNGYCPQPGP